MIELADIFRQHGSEYRQQYAERMLPSHLQAMRDIERCRTEALGGQVYHCPDCQEMVYRYHSCRNRHCPKCQNGKSEEWLEAQRDLLLPVPYFLLTITLPDELRTLARANQQVFYNLLFRTSAAATQKLAADPRFIGGQIGMVGVLHTWGRNLSYHPHVHYLVPCGGLSPDGQTWLPGNKDFLLPVKALARIFRAKFRTALQKTEFFDQIPSTVWQQDWVLHAQPVGDGRAALKYLAPYIFRVAISNRRILKLENDQVTFRFKDTQTGKTKLCTLSALEFIRRFLQHILPRGFVKVRYYGLFSPRWRARLSILQQQLASLFPPVHCPPEPDHDPVQTVETDYCTVRCPSCGKVLTPQPLPRRQSRPP
jgi:predicted RNA-binding Zn-ribbon protein involved in translation (DUF1610 family)